MHFAYLSRPTAQRINDDDDDDDDEKNTKMTAILE